MRSFENIAKLIRTKRLSHPSGYSQSELSSILGYKNGQFISNVERALCNVPLKMLSKVGVVLNIEPQEIKNAILLDEGKTLDNYLAIRPKDANVTAHSTQQAEGSILPFAAASNDEKSDESEVKESPLRNVG